MTPVDIITNGYGSVNGISSTNVINASYDTNVEPSSVLDIVNSTALPVASGHSSPFDNGNSHFFASHNSGKYRRALLIQILTVPVLARVVSAVLSINFW